MCCFDCHKIEGRATKMSLNQFTGANASLAKPVKACSRIGREVYVQGPGMA